MLHTKLLIQCFFYILSQHNNRIIFQVNQCQKGSCCPCMAGAKYDKDKMFRFSRCVSSQKLQLSGYTVELQYNLYNKVCSGFHMQSYLEPQCRGACISDPDVSGAVKNYFASSNHLQGILGLPCVLQIYYVIINWHALIVTIKFYQLPQSL